MKSIICAVALFSLTASCTAQKAGCVERKKGGGATCFMASRPPAECEKYFLQADYYNGFTSPAGLFNQPEQPGGCRPWRFFLAGDNCNDNPNFNEFQHCNRINPAKPFAPYPRIQVVGRGRLGARDSCVLITCYPGDNYHTKKQNGRAEMVLRPEIMRDSSYWYAWSFRLPEGFTLDTRASCGNAGFRYTHCIISQIHTTEKEKEICDRPSLPFNLNLRKEGDGFMVAVNFGAVCGDDHTANRHGRFAVVPGIWYDVLLHITWSADPAVAGMEIEVYSEGSESPLFTNKAGGVKSLFRDEGNGFGIFHLGAYTGKNFCSPVSLQFDEVSFARKKCCLKSPRVSCACE